jgi:hypothetical protein
MPTTDKDRIAHSLRRVAEEEESARGERRDALLILATCVLWAGLGLFLVMWSAHTSSVEHGQIALGAGVVIGNGGVVATLIYAWYRAQRKR